MTTTTGNGKAAPFAHRPPSLSRQVALGAYVYGVLTPFVWTLERLGWARRTMSCAISRRERALVDENPLRSYVAGPQDVVVATYIKSGTNWMMQIVHQLIHHGEGDFGHIHDVVPWPDTKGMPRFMRDYAIPLEDAEAWRHAPEKMRVIKTHLHAKQLPMSDRARYIMVIRDPKDAFVSNYHFIRDGFLGPAMPSVETWFKLFIKGKAPGGSWVDNAKENWAVRHRLNVKVFSFKAMKRDLPGTVRQVADFLGIRVSDEVLAAVCAKSSFAYMKQIDHKFRIGRLIPWQSEGAMLRKGAQGGSAELLSLERQREIDATFVAELKRHRSDLPYEEFADLA